SDTNYYIARQTQWLFRPAVAVTLAPNVELSLALAVQQSVTDTTRGHFVSDSQPYGYGNGGRFGEAGVQLALHLDTRDEKRHARSGNVVDLTASYVAAAGDVTHPFETIDGRVAHYLTFPLPLHPFLGLRVGGKKVFGDAPIQDAAYVGGDGSIRTRYPQSLGGDASLYGTAELRIPVVKFTLLLPANAGLLATQDVGRVWVKGESPGGWHSAFGGGFWVGVNNLTADIRVMRAEDGKPVVIAFRLGRTLGPWQ
ncbi:MAG: BamA/TamA family outer membrane protein, partial [Gemmatimonadota bacterium]